MRLRRLMAWAGILTLAALSALALANLLSDIGAIFSVRGGSSAVFGRLAPPLVLALAALSVTMIVAWLAGSGRRREWVAVGIGFAVLLGVRVFVAASFDGVIRGEPQAYGDFAELVLAGDWGFVDRPIGYPALLAGAYAIFGDRQLATEALNLLLATLAGGVVLSLTRGLYGGRAGALALLAYALWPAGALMTTVRMPEVVYDLAILASAWAAVGTAPGWRGSALTGVLLGLAQWLRPSTPALLPVFLLARLWPGGPWRRLVSGAAFPFIAAFLLVLTPVIWDNAQEDGRLSISTSAFGGQVLYIGTYEPSGGTFDREAMEALIAISGPDKADISRVGAQIALERIAEDPIGIAALAVRKQGTLWGTERFGVEYGITRWLLDRPTHPRAVSPFLLSQSFYVLVLMAATAGLYLKRREPDALIALTVALIWSVAAIHALFEVRDRYHSYVIPLLLPIAALALATLWDRAARMVGRSAGE